MISGGNVGEEMSKPTKVALHGQIRLVENRLQMQGNTVSNPYL
jgi:hypothetical protein